MHPLPMISLTSCYAYDKLKNLGETKGCKSYKTDIVLTLYLSLFKFIKSEVKYT